MTIATWHFRLTVLWLTLFLGVFGCLPAATASASPLAASSMKCQFAPISHSQPAAPQFPVTEFDDAGAAMTSSESALRRWQDNTYRMFDHNRRNAKFGIDALHPIRIVDGVISPLVTDPSIIAETGAGWVRLNFVLGPWSSPVDRTRHHGCTWEQTYRAIIDGYRRAGMRIYGLISYEAMPIDPGDSLRQPPPAEMITTPWVDGYLDNFVRIVHLFRRDLSAVESLNEPDDWHGGRSSWIHPAWFAIIQQRIYERLERDPALVDLTLVSGPLQGMTTNNNGAPRYLDQVYRQGEQRFGWGQAGIPFPFDGVGYHLYIRDRFYRDPTQQRQALENAYARYTSAMLKVIQQHEGALRPLYISEIGWSSRPEEEELQAANLQTVFTLIADDPNVTIAIWFAIQDFDVPGNVMRYGLYRQGEVGEAGRKPAWAAFVAAMDQLQ